jgi:predicted cupin superfamily sugar epimerase
MIERAAELIATLGLRPHPEGGHYGEVFRSAARVRPADRDVERVALTTIYFLLEAGEWSRWHRVAADEAWHFYEGDALDLLWLDADGDAVRRARLGPAAAGTRPVAVVPAGCWQAARPLGAYTLVGCTVAPGFEFADFTLLADRPEDAARVRARHPELANLI